MFLRCPPCRSQSSTLRYERILAELLSFDRTGDFSFLPDASYSLYWRVIAQPVSLTSIRSKVRRKAYALDGPWEFIKDLSLLVQNAKTLHMPNTRQYKAAAALQRKANELLIGVLELKVRDPLSLVGVHHQDLRTTPAKRAVSADTPGAGPAGDSLLLATQSASSQRFGVRRLSQQQLPQPPVLQADNEPTEGFRAERAALRRGGAKGFFVKAGTPSPTSPKSAPLSPSKLLRLSPASIRAVSRLFSDWRACREKPFKDSGPPVGVLQCQGFPPTLQWTYTGDPAEDLPGEPLLRVNDISDLPIAEPLSPRPPPTPQREPYLLESPLAPGEAAEVAALRRAEPFLETCHSEAPSPPPEGVCSSASAGPQGKTQRRRRRRPPGEGGVSVVASAFDSGVSARLEEKTPSVADALETLALFGEVSLHLTPPRVSAATVVLPALETDLGGAFRRSLHCLYRRRPCEAPEGVLKGHLEESFLWTESCAVCGSLEEASAFFFCNSCGEAVHPRCAGAPPSPATLSGGSFCPRPFQQLAFGGLSCGRCLTCQVCSAPSPCVCPLDAGNLRPLQEEAVVLLGLAPEWGVTSKASLGGDAPLALPRQQVLSLSLSWWRRGGRGSQLVAADPFLGRNAESLLSLKRRNLRAALSSPEGAAIAGSLLQVWRCAGCGEGAHGQCIQRGTEGAEALRNSSVPSLSSAAPPSFADRTFGSPCVNVPSRASPPGEAVPTNDGALGEGMWKSVVGGCGEEASVLRISPSESLPPAGLPAAAPAASLSSLGKGGCGVALGSECLPATGAAVGLGRPFLPAPSALSSATRAKDAFEAAQSGVSPLPLSAAGGPPAFASSQFETASLLKAGAAAGAAAAPVSVASLAQFSALQLQPELGLAFSSPASSPLGVVPAPQGMAASFMRENRRALVVEGGSIPQAPPGCAAGEMGRDGEDEEAEESSVGVLSTPLDTTGSSPSDIPPSEAAPPFVISEQPLHGLPHQEFPSLPKERVFQSPQQQGWPPPQQDQGLFPRPGLSFHNFLTPEQPTLLPQTLTAQSAAEGENNAALVLEGDTLSTYGLVRQVQEGRELSDEGWGLERLSAGGCADALSVHPNTNTNNAHAAAHSSILVSAAKSAKRMRLVEPASEESGSLVPPLLSGVATPEAASAGGVLRSLSNFKRQGNFGESVQSSYASADVQPTPRGCGMESLWTAAGGNAAEFSLLCKKCVSRISNGKASDAAVARLFTEASGLLESLERQRVLGVVRSGGRGSFQSSPFEDALGPSGGPPSSAHVQANLQILRCALCSCLQVLRGKAEGCGVPEEARPKFLFKEREALCADCQDTAGKGAADALENAASQLQSAACLAILREEIESSLRRSLAPRLVEAQKTKDSAETPEAGTLDGPAPELTTGLAELAAVFANEVWLAQQTDSSRIKKETVSAFAVRLRRLCAEFLSRLLQGPQTGNAFFAKCAAAFLQREKFNSGEAEAGSWESPRKVGLQETQSSRAAGVAAEG